MSLKIVECYKKKELLINTKDFKRKLSSLGRVKKAQVTHVSSMALFVLTNMLKA